MILFLFFILLILAFAFIIMSGVSWEHDVLFIALAGICFLLVFIVMIFGCFHGLVYYPETEGTHQGVITAVDLEGVYFRRYEVYLKSSGYTNQSDETKYLLYDYEKELAQELKDSIGKEVQLNYGHDGGYIGWKSCGTYHVKSFKIIEKVDEKTNL